LVVLVVLAVENVLEGDVRVECGDGILKVKDGFELKIQNVYKARLGSDSLLWFKILNISFINSSIYKRFSNSAKVFAYSLMFTFSNLTKMQNRRLTAEIDFTRLLC